MRGSKEQFGLGVASAVLLGALMACGGGGSDSSSSAAPATTFLAPLPDDASRSGVELYRSSNWRVIRQWPAGEILVYRKSNEIWRPLPFAAGARALALQVLEGGGALYIFVYDPESNIPSGSGLGSVSEGIDLWRFDPASTELTRVGQGLPLGGLDNAIHARERSGAIDACAIDTCIRVSPAGMTRWNTGAIAGYPLSGYEIVDLRFEADEAHAIVRPVDDHYSGNANFGVPPYAIARLRIDGSSVQVLPQECVPFSLATENGAPTWKCASSISEYAEILRHDIARQPHGGLGDFGLPNTEGRIAWSLVYTLNALLDINSREMPRLAAARDWSAERVPLREALSLVARQRSANPLGYAARRYSLDRSPLLFALHLSRTAHLLVRAQELGMGSPEIADAIPALHAVMTTLEGTAEERIVESGYDTLGFRRGIAFWADGANVPFNYVSDYVLGVLAASSAPKEEAERAASLMKALQDLEQPGTVAIWHYWWGRGRNGWQAGDNVSVNTPAYVGQPAVAHITYRSHDAMALIRLASIDSSKVPEGTIENLRRLVAEGGLLPFVNEELVRLNRTAALDAATARRYARSAAPWELQAQVWALEALAGQ